MAACVDCPKVAQETVAQLLVQQGSNELQQWVTENKEQINDGIIEQVANMAFKELVEVTACPGPKTVDNTMIGSTSITCPMFSLAIATSVEAGRIMMRNDEKSNKQNNGQYL